MIPFSIYSSMSTISYSFPHNFCQGKERKNMKKSDIRHFWGNSGTPRLCPSFITSDELFNLPNEADYQRKQILIQSKQPWSKCAFNRILNCICYTERLCAGWQMKDVNYFNTSDAFWKDPQWNITSNMDCWSFLSKKKEYSLLKFLLKSFLKGFSCIFFGIFPNGKAKMWQEFGRHFP